MTRIGYHASHEQFSPSDLLGLVQLAEQSGFEYVLSSDHIHPWSDAQDSSGFAWSWLGAALQATTLPFSVVSVPGYRYHPAVLAQAIATLNHMYPGRFTQPCLGSGEALNEHVIGGMWPRKQARNAVLQESVGVMRRLWAGENVTHVGAIAVEDAQLYTLPKEHPQVYGAALSEATAEWLGSWADGMVTVSDNIESLQRRVEAFRRSGGEAKPMILKAQLSYDASYEAALDGAVHQWRSTLLPASVLGELRSVDQFEAAGVLVGHELVEQKVKIITDPQECVTWIQQFIDLGFETVVLHNVNRDQEQFIHDFGKHALPLLKER